MTMELLNSRHPRSFDGRRHGGLATGSVLSLTPSTSSKSSVSSNNDDGKQHHSNVAVKWSSVMASTPFWMTLLMLMVCLAGRASCDYENTWNFYNEPACCGGVGGGELQRHVKYKRGKCFVINNSNK